MAQEIEFTSEIEPGVELVHSQIRGYNGQVDIWLDPEEALSVAFQLAELSHIAARNQEEKSPV